MCDPNPGEYTDTMLQTPNVVFYWGVYSREGNCLHVSSIAEDFKKKLGKGFEGPCGELDLSIREAFEVPNQMS